MEYKKCKKCVCLNMNPTGNTVGNYENVNAEVALTLAEKIKRHPKLWKWFFMVA